ncbi:pirin family protein [Phaeobacter inhibens]|uniref:pirin family protein n=1 Tax=Phaeobacter inhibens TaxID=221822 RepID=UPI0009FA5CEE|nr:pirin family protein [Phaeobacter inhibens]
MTSQNLEILHRDTLTEGGFAGLKEHRLVTGKKLWGDRANPDAWDGIGNFVYLADARFNPKGETTMHPHKEIDVISVMVEGRVAHQGSLEHGGSLDTNDAQVQRAGGEGFKHNEVNPDETQNRMLQLWVMPEVKGEPAGYKKFSPTWGETVRIYGGLPDHTKSFSAETTIDVAMLTAGQSIELTAPYLAYVAKGDGQFETTHLTGGDLIRGANGTFTATTDVQFILVGTLA